MSASGACTFASLTPNRGVGGAPRDVRVLGGTPVRRIMTRYARRLRGALRPMTRQYTGRNNVTISMLGGRSVPIVSQTEINPMKTAPFPHARARHDDGAHRALPGAKPQSPGGSCLHSLHRERLILQKGGCEKPHGTAKAFDIDGTPAVRREAEE